MYSTCIFCNKALGRNEALEAFPVGQRIAFDAKRGRLWVVCRGCERWNLSPFDERWEGVEQAERAYRDTRLRVATENIGLAKLRDGTTLVRIGEPMRPEFAAWRYGDQFGRRRTRSLIMTGASLAAGGALIAGGLAAGIGISAFSLASFAWQRQTMRQMNAVIARVRTVEHGILRIRPSDIGGSHIGLDANGEFSVQLRTQEGEAVFSGREAARVASLVIPVANRFGGGRTSVAKAVAEIEASGGPEAYLRSIAELAPTLSGTWVIGRGPDWRTRARNPDKYGDTGLPAPRRLALEMALHEESERRAMEGELAELERAWRDAEEIAAIADSLTVPAPVDAEFQRLKGTTGAEG